MSRTRRRKNYVVENNNSWDRKGKKTALEYTEYDVPRQGTGKFFYNFRDEYVEIREACTIEYREGDKGERWWRTRMMHGESSTSNCRSPNRWYRLNRQKQNRSINKQEFNRWRQYDGEYEPMFEANPRDCWWDWS